MFTNKALNFNPKNFPSFNSRIIVAGKEYIKNLELYSMLLQIMN